MKLPDEAATEVLMEQSVLETIGYVPASQHCSKETGILPQHMEVPYLHTRLLQPHTAMSHYYTLPYFHVNYYTYGSIALHKPLNSK